MAADVNDSIDQRAVVSLSPGGRVTTEEELSPVELAVPLQGPHTLTSQTGLETPPWRHHPARPAWGDSFLISTVTDRAILSRYLN